MVKKLKQKKEKRIPKWKAKKRFAQLPEKTQIADRKKTAKHTTKRATAQWMKDPKHGDVRGIDTKMKEKKKKKKKLSKSEARKRIVHLLENASNNLEYLMYYPHIVEASRLIGGNIETADYGNLQSYEDFLHEYDTYAEELLKLRMYHVRDQVKDLASKNSTRLMIESAIERTDDRSLLLYMVMKSGKYNANEVKHYIYFAYPKLKKLDEFFKATEIVKDEWIKWS